MRALTSKQTLELLKQGGVIEFTSWGMNPMIHVRLGDKFLDVHRSAFNSLALKGLLKQTKQERLTYTYVLASNNRKETEVTK